MYFYVLIGVGLCYACPPEIFADWSQSEYSNYQPPIKSGYLARNIFVRIPEFRWPTQIGGHNFIIGKSQ